MIFLNVPAITYNAHYGLSFSLLRFQILFGISFSYMGYLSSVWTFGIPLGGLKLNKETGDGTITEKEIMTE